jgi:hypothetical protein
MFLSVSSDHTTIHIFKMDPNNQTGVEVNGVDEDAKEEGRNQG